MKRNNQAESNAKKLEQLRRRARLLEIFEQQPGIDQSEAAKALASEGFVGSSEATVSRDLKKLIPHAAATLAQKRAVAVEELRAFRHRTIADSDMSDSQIADFILQVHDRLAKLEGLNAADKVELSSGPQIDPLTIEVRTLLFDLPEEERKKVRDYAKSLVPPVTLDAKFFSEPEPDQLTEGDSNDFV